MEKEAVKRLLKQVFWDRRVDSEMLYKILHQEVAEFEGITLNKIYLRLLESYSWYTILDIITPANANAALSEEVISKIWNKALKKKYAYVRRLLSEQTLSIAGQGATLV